MTGTWRAARLIAGNDLRRRARDWSLIIQAVVAPIVLGLIVGLAFRGGPTVSTTIGVADATDGSAIAARIVDSLSGSAGGSAGSGDDGPASLRFVELAADGANRAIDTGEVDAVLVLAGSPEQAVAGAEPVRINVIGDAGDSLSQSIAASVASSIAAQLRTTSIAAGTIARLQQPDPDQLAELYAVAQQVTPALSVSSAAVASDFNIISYFAPAMAMLFLFFTMGAGARSVSTERREGTLARIRAAPVSDDAVLVGKTIGVFVLGAVSLASVWAVTAIGFGVRWGDPVGVAAVLLGVVVAIAGISLLISGLARTENQADALTVIVSLALSVLGGSFFFGATGAITTMKQFTPNGQALNALTELAAGEGTLADVAPSVVLLVALGVLTGVVGVVALRKKVAS